MAQAIVPYTPPPAGSSPWSRHVLVVGAIASVALSWRGGALVGGGVLFAAVLGAKVLDELAKTR